MSPLTKDSLKGNAIAVVYEAYVRANKEAAVDPQVTARAREIFNKMEEGDEEMIDSWKMFQKWTTEELSATYGRLGVSFDEYAWESSYSRKQIGGLLDSLEAQGLLRTDQENRKAAHILGKNVTLLKSDGSSLYLLRDLAAAVDRRFVLSSQGKQIICQQQ